MRALDGSARAQPQQLPGSRPPSRSADGRVPGSCGNDPVVELPVPDLRPPSAGPPKLHRTRAFVLPGSTDCGEVARRNPGGPPLASARLGRPLAWPARPRRARLIPLGSPAGLVPARMRALDGSARAQPQQLPGSRPPCRSTDGGRVPGSCGDEPGDVLPSSCGCRPCGYVRQGPPNFTALGPSFWLEAPTAVKLREATRRPA
jgi:hypothetical protein